MKGSTNTLLAIAACAIAACTDTPPDAPSGSEGATGDAVPNLRALASPAGPGSAEPNLVRGPAGAIVLSWLEPADGATALRYATLDDDAWSAPVTISQSDSWFVNWADFPSVVPIDGPLWAAHWLVKRPGGTYAYDVALAVSTDRGQSWSEPVTPHRDGTATEHGFVSLFPADGGVGAMWLDGRNMTGGHVGDGGMTLRSAVFSADLERRDVALVDDLVCDCCQTDVAIAASGPVAAYRNRTEAEIRDIYVTRLVDGAWTPGAAVADDGWEIGGCPVNGPVIRADGQQVTVAWFTGAGGESAVRYARSTDGAETFGAATDVATERPIGRVGLAMLDDGGALVSWMRQREAGSAELVVRRIDADGIARERQVIAQLAAGRMSGVPQMVRYGRGVVLAWTDAAGESTRVRTATYTPAR